MLLFQLLSLWIFIYAWFPFKKLNLGHRINAPPSYCNMLRLLAHILGQKQVWIGDDGKLWLAVVYGCPQVTSQSKGYVDTAGLGPWITTDPSNEQQTGRCTQPPVSQGSRLLRDRLQWSPIKMSFIILNFSWQLSQRFLLDCDDCNARISKDQGKEY